MSLLGKIFGDKKTNTNTTSETGLSVANENEIAGSSGQIEAANSSLNNVNVTSVDPGAIDFAENSFAGLLENVQEGYDAVADLAGKAFEQAGETLKLGAAGNANALGVVADVKKDAMENGWDKAVKIGLVLGAGVIIVWGIKTWRK